MKYKSYIISFFLTAIYFVGALCLFNSSMTFAENMSKIRLLVITGGHSYDVPAFEAMLHSFPQLEISQARFPDDLRLIAPGLEKKYDVILFYDQNNSPLSDEYKKNVKALFQQGIGVFCLHHHLSSNQNWDEYCELIGGRDFAFKEQTVLYGKMYPRSTFVDDQTMKMTIADKEHPITKGVNDFTIVDEAYGKCLVLPNAVPILTTKHPLSTSVVAWTWKYGRSPVFVNMLGHDAKAYNNPEFRKILIQGIEYLNAELNAERRK